MDNAYWRKRTYATLLVGAMFHLVVALLITDQMPQTEDGPSYRSQALSMIDGNQGYFFFPPGTAIAALPWYATFGRSVLVDHLVATSFWIAFSIACAWLAWLVCSDKRAAWLASLMASFLPHSILATGTISSQPLTAALIATALCTGIRAYQTQSLLKWGLTCTLLGAAVLARPATLALTGCAGIIVMWAWWRNKVPARSALLALGLLIVSHLLVMMPVMWHNHKQGQGYALSTNNEWNLLVGNNPYTPDYKTGHFGQRTFDKLPDSARAYLTTFLPHQQPAYATYQQRMDMRDSALHYMADHPFRTFYRVSNRFRGFWGMDYTASRELQNAYGLPRSTTSVLLLIEGGSFVIILFLAVFYLLILAGKHVNALTYIFVAASITPYLVAFTVAKYHTVVLPILFPLSAMALVWITSQEGRKQTLRYHWKKLLFMALIIIAVQLEHIYHIVDNH
jgi:4-amino-4-deoxy-L-arabinose transferase-like glycosyltransferase